MKYRILRQDPEERDEELKPYFNSLKKSEFSSSFKTMSQRLLANPSMNRRTSSIYLLHYKKISAAAAVVFLFISLSAFKINTTEKVAEILQFDVRTSDTKAFNEINQLIKTSRFQPLRFQQVRKGENIHFYAVSKDALLDETLVGQLSGIKGIMELKKNKVEVPVKESILSAIAYKTFSYHISAERLNGMQLEKMLNLQLEEQQIYDLRFSVRTVKPGDREISLKQIKQSKDNYDFDVTVQDGNNVVKIKQKKNNTPLPENIMEFTDEEVRAFITEQQGWEPDKVPQMRIERSANKITVILQENAGTELKLILTKPEKK